MASERSSLPCPRGSVAGPCVRSRTDGASLIRLVSSDHIRRICGSSEARSDAIVVNAGMAALTQTRSVWSSQMAGQLPAVREPDNSVQQINAKVSRHFGLWVFWVWGVPPYGGTPEPQTPRQNPEPGNPDTPYAKCQTCHCARRIDAPLFGGAIQHERS